MMININKTIQVELITEQYQNQLAVRKWQNTCTAGGSSFRKTESWPI